MAEYYPLLAKAVGSIPNSTPESRRVVYERARKALIGQLRTLHPPIPDDDIETESVALDRAIERLEAELANGGIPAAAAPAVPDTPKPAQPPKAPGQPKLADAAKPPAVKPSAVKPPAGKPAAPGKPSAKGPPDAKGDAKPDPAPTTGKTGAAGPDEKPLPLRPKGPKPLGPRPSGDTSSDIKAVPALPPGPTTPPAAPPATSSSDEVVATMPAAAVVATEVASPPTDPVKRLKPPRSDPQRPIAPQPPVVQGPKRRLWIIPVAVGVVVAAVAFAAWKLRDHPETIAHGKPAEPAQADSGKIAERVGGPTTPSTAPRTQQADTPTQTPAPQPQQNAPATNNPELPVAHRAALLVEAPDEPNKVKTFLGTVVWKLNNVPQGPNDAVGLAVEADIDLPDDKMKAVVTFAKNTEASLPASHTINVRYSVDPGSYTGNVKQISVPQMRPEASPSGEPLAGVTVQIVPNSFLVGLSPGNAETANTDLIRRLQWIDIPMLLDSGKLAKLTFEKSESGQRDLAEALDAWAKQ